LTTDLPLDGKVALITGAASGICRAVAKMVVREGGSVAIVDRDRQGAEAVVAEIEDAGGRAIAIVLDVRDTSAIADGVAKTIEQMGSIDILVNGVWLIRWPDTLFDITEEQWDDTFAVNTKAQFVFMKHVAQHMVERGEGGHIVNIASENAFTAAGPIAYGASKGALLPLTRMGASQLGLENINVNCVSPGPTKTPGILTRPHAPTLEDVEKDVREGHLKNLLQRPNEAEDVASVILFLCLPASRQVTGQVIHVSGGMIV